MFESVGDKEINEEGQDVYEDSVFTNEETHLAVISRTEYEDCIETNGKNFMTGLEALTALREIQILRALPNDKILALGSCLKIQNFDDKSTIIWHTRSR